MEINYAAENLSTEQPPPGEKARLQSSYGDQERPRRIETPSCKRTQKINGSALLSLGLPKHERLRKRAEFVRVYGSGKRFEGRYMTVFILPNEIDRQRLGVTATKKGIGKAHDRVRAKRLLREAFRLNRAALSGLNENFDWVLNARRPISRVKLSAPLEELERIIAAVGSLSNDSLPQKGPKEG